jgi:hypothetical protein
MTGKRIWRHSEEKILIDQYDTKTIKELMVILGKSQESINCKIKRLKSAGKIKGGKEEDTIKRAYIQRGDVDKIKINVSK